MLNLDADQRPEDIIPVAQLTIVGQACLKRAEVSARARAKAGASLPAGIQARDGNDKPICYAYNRCQRCVQEPCQMAHACWWCLAEDHAGKNCPNKPAGATD